MTQQTPIGSGFGAASTAMEVVSGIDLSGKLAVVTGGASGLGLDPHRIFNSNYRDLLVCTISMLCSLSDSRNSS